MDYKQAGVDTEKARSLIYDLKETIQNTHENATAGGVLGQFGGFAGIFRPGSQFAGHDLVACTDGVGTKLELCRRYGYFDGCGTDLVAMCVNDLYCTGAVPAFFLDYIACGRLNDSWYKPVMQSIARACEETSMALLGGETAEHPGVMGDDDFDLAGFCVGLRPPGRKLPDTDALKAGDLLVGLGSSGLHSNGFSLVRKLLEDLRQSSPSRYQQLTNDESWVRDRLLQPTRIYHQLSETTDEVKAAVHITGGGYYENIPRVLPEHLGAVVERAESFSQPIFEFVSEQVGERDCYSTFNMGVGMVLVTAASDADAVAAKLGGQVMGELVAGEAVLRVKGIDT